MTEPRKSRRPFWVAWILFAGLVLYPLSIGPFLWLGIMSSGSKSTPPRHLDTEYLEHLIILDSPLYAPITWLQFHGPEFGQNAINWYLDFWFNLAW
jgi:hypothetical protein